MGLEELLDGNQIVAVICNQWGDSGKGKVTDLIASEGEMDVTARGTGGNNAGHTVVINGKEKIYHLLPTGIANDSNGHICIMGNGMVIDVEVLNEELDDLDKEGKTYDNLMISKDAHVIMPWHIERDKAKNQSQKAGGIGSTGRGIGPCYADKAIRSIAIRIADLFDEDGLVKKISKAKESYPEQEIDAKEIVDYLHPFTKRIGPFVRDTVTEMHRFVRQGKKILLEGAQGLLLSIEHGTYPYVTSSDCSLNGTANGVGLSARDVDLPIGIVKFPFMTRVGAGPFPTELGGEKSEEYCAEGDGYAHDIFYEVREYLEMGIDLRRVRLLQESLRERGNQESRKELLRLKEEVYRYIRESREKVVELINSRDLFKQGVGIRLAALEYGATTGRPRRIGWTDAVAAKYAVDINCPFMILTKPDCIAGVNNFKICHGYKVGPTPHINFNKDAGFLRSVKPNYEFGGSYRGYEDISEIREYQELPSGFRRAVNDFEEFTRGRVIGVSVGSDRNAIIVR